MAGRELVTTRKIDKNHRIHLPAKYLIMCGLYENGEVTKDDIVIICRDKKIIIEKAEQ